MTFKYNGKVEAKRDFTVIESSESASEQDFWDEEDELAMNRAKGVFGKSDLKDHTKPPKEHVASKPIIIFCSKYGQCAPGDYR